MATSAETVLLDTSAAIALVRPEQAGHIAVREAVRGRSLGLSGHATFETYSVLTRLPPPQRLSPAAAARLIATNFPIACHLAPNAAGELVASFAATGISGGAVYDALVAAAAVSAGLPLLSVDRRAEPVYRALGVDLRIL
ncbi:PIN domain-containing protein [Gordonia sp. LSe1-13]|uniref:Ribonuclease VapC n=1 Tax=Gordonia sesuvii TaxID=3116777 RepID=A0ABU7MAT5_9ACTN|nr:PIN domain-containing protein [Gordonia sp. LSe1-13]